MCYRASVEKECGTVMRAEPQTEQSGAGGGGGVGGVVLSKTCKDYQIITTKTVLFLQIHPTIVNGLVAFLRKWPQIKKA
jgi:hypothetical protein